MNSPSYIVKMGSQEITSQGKSEGSICEIKVRSEIGLINEADIVMPRAIDLSANVGDEVEISLGSEQAEVVYTGVISELKYQLNNLCICSTSIMTALSSGYVNTIFEQKSSGNIAKDLCGPYSISMGTVEEGLEYPVYTIDHKRSILDHLLALSMQNGWHLYADMQDKLMMTSKKSSMTHLLVYGKNILAFEYAEFTERVVGVSVFGESPVGQGQGKEAYSWISQKEVKGTSGNTNDGLQLTNPALKDMESAQTAAEKTLALLKSGGNVSIVVPGNPNIRLQDLLLIKNVPEGKGSGSYTCTHVSHSFTYRTGFITKIEGKEI